MKFFPSLSTLVLACVATCTSWPALAQDASAPWLPAPAQVEAALQAHPLVRAAAERVQAARATRHALDVGSHEFQADAVLQRRNVRDEQRRFNEWELGLSRTIRLPRKAALDRLLGDGTYHLASLRLKDAEHQVARRLLDAWGNWQRSSAMATETAAQSQLLERERAALARRLALGDAAQRDMDVLGAECAAQAAQAAQVLMARDAREVARQALVSGFAPIAVPEQPAPLPDPTDWLDDTQDWRARIVSESAAVAIAQGVSHLQARTAERARAERARIPPLVCASCPTGAGANAPWAWCCPSLWELHTAVRWPVQKAPAPWLPKPRLPMCSAPSSKRPGCPCRQPTASAPSGRPCNRH